MGRARGDASTNDRFTAAFGQQLRGGLINDSADTQRLVGVVADGEVDGAIDLLVGARHQLGARPALQPLSNALAQRLTKEIWHTTESLAGGFTTKALALTQPEGSVVGPEEHLKMGVSLHAAVAGAVKAQTDQLLGAGELHARRYRDDAQVAADEAITTVFAERAAAGGEAAVASALGSHGYAELQRLLRRRALSPLCPLAAWQQAFSARWADDRAYAAEGKGRLLARELLLSPWLEPAIREAAGWQPDTRRVVVMPAPANESRAMHETIADGPAGDARLEELLAAGGRLQ